MASTQPHAELMVQVRTWLTGFDSFESWSEHDQGIIRQGEPRVGFDVQEGSLQAMHNDRLDVSVFSHR